MSEHELSRRSMLLGLGALPACATAAGAVGGAAGTPGAAGNPSANTAAGAFSPPQAVPQEARFELPEPGPMLPPVPAIVLGVAGDGGRPDDLGVAWTFVVNGQPGQVGISVTNDPARPDHQPVALALLAKHGAFTLNVPDASWLEKFDAIDMSSSQAADKFAAHGLTRLPSKLIDAPGIAEAAIVLECKVAQTVHLPPKRTIFLADVVRVSVHPGVTDAAGRLVAASRPFYGMTAGNGEFWTFGTNVGHIGQTKGRTDIRY